MNLYENRNEKLSILVPAYNESITIVELLNKVLDVALVNGIEKEVIVVDDCSKDNTWQLLQRYKEEHPTDNIQIIKQLVNQGKGSALRAAIKIATGTIIVVQDADLELDPNDFNQMLPLILSGKHRVVYGSRFLHPENKHTYTSFYMGGRLVTLCANLLFFQKLTDEPTCYKMFRADLLKSISLKCRGFEFCPEVTAKVAKKGIKIPEIPIHYYPRSIEEGKKLRWHDGLETLWTLIKYRFVN